MKNIHFFSLKYHPLHQVNVIANVVCNVTYVTAFNKCSDFVVKSAFYDSLSYEQDNSKYVRCPAAAASIIIHFYLDNMYQNEPLKTGVALSNCSFKTIFLIKKRKFCVFLKPNEYVSTTRSKHFKNAQRSFEKYLILVIINILMNNLI